MLRVAAIFTLAANFCQTNQTCSQGDFNYRSTVNLADFTILAVQFGKTLPAPGSANFSGVVR